eukprot:6200220-Karenia_brevis.AAC.1
MVESNLVDVLSGALRPDIPSAQFVTPSLLAQRKQVQRRTARLASASVLTWSGRQSHSQQTIKRKPAGSGAAKLTSSGNA